MTEQHHDFLMVKTRFLILSDTHGLEYRSEEWPAQHADVAIYCGDLTEESKIAEFRTSLELLKAVNAPLKLVIAGNHDFTMDIPAFKKKIAEAQPSLDPELVKQEYGDYGAVEELFEAATSAGVIFLDEGSHHFSLENGAKLTVYASPWTPSLGDWGFQYDPAQGHSFDIPDGIDVVITHGPPKGIMDYTEDKKRAGCPDLFGAVARARPRLHCFGHVHEGWGAKLITWRDQPSETPSYFTDIDNEKSVLVENLSSFKKTKFDTPQIVDEKAKRELCYRQLRCCTTSHCREDAVPLRYRTQTLFVNAAIQPTEEHHLQLPWLVDIELPLIFQANV